MNFIDYCISTKNFSALNAVEDYTKSFGILDNLKRSIRKKQNYLKEKTGSKGYLDSLLHLGRSMRALGDRKTDTSNAWRKDRANVAELDRAEAKKHGWLSGYGMGYTSGKHDAFDKVERDAAKKRKKDDYVDPLTLSLAERLAKVDPHKLNDFQTEKKYGGDARTASSKTRLSTRIPNLNAHKPSDQKVNAEFRKAMIEHPELFGGSYNSIPEFNKSYNKKVAKD